MEAFEQARLYFLNNQDTFWTNAQRHMSLSLSALLIATLIGIPLGVLIARRLRLAEATINFFGALRLVPSIAVLFLALPYLRTGFRPALVALTILAVPPILINTYAGLQGVGRATVEAALGMGMSPRQVLWRVELPLALPAIIGGLRLAAVEVIASATLAAFIGGGGLGDFITRGFAVNDPSIMLVGAIPVALLALLAELLFGIFQRRLSTPLA
ncbi:MAG TPA: ABC transporter permease [Roseiflexaceae bacterium]|nr:ABC transporter permease [Roseiflexaceae bacterium]